MPDNFKEIWTDEYLDAKRQESDPVADSVITTIIEDRGSSEAMKLFDILIRNIKMPLNDLHPSVNEYIKQSSELPSWVNHHQIQLAQAYFLDHGPKFLPILYYKSLPTLYACEKGAQVLVKTGRLAHQNDGHIQFSRRIAETGQFLINVMAPGGFDEVGEAISYIQKVRLIHASIRRFVKLGDWDAGNLGQPINQEDLAITLMTFSVSILDGLEKFGLVTPPHIQEAYLHHWKVVGHILGIDNDLLPENYPQARYLLNKILERHAGPSAAGKILTSALIQFSKDVIPTEKLDGSSPIFIKYLIGEKMATDLGVETRTGCLSFLLPEFLKSFFNIVEKLEDMSEPINFIFEKLSIQVTRKMVEYFNTYKGQKFQIPENLKKAWGL